MVDEMLVSHSPALSTSPLFSWDPDATRMALLNDQEIVPRAHLCVLSWAISSNCIRLNALNTRENHLHDATLIWNALLVVDI